jgi:hypothetical protein
VRTAALVIICAVAISACGGNGKSNGSTASAGSSLALEFAKCMRAHGVPNFPDPGAPAGNVVNQDSPAVEAVGATCDRLEPNNPQPSRKPSEARIKSAFVAARCMRAHGVSGFPDPTLTPPSGANTMDEGGVYFVLPTGFAANAPAARRAAHACGLGPP